MLRSEAITKTMEFAEHQATVNSIANGMDEELVKAHLLVKRAEAEQVIGEYLDLFRTVGFITDVQDDPLPEPEKSEDTSETSEETSED